MTAPFGAFAADYRALENSRTEARAERDRARDVSVALLDDNARLEADKTRLQHTINVARAYVEALDCECGVFVKCERCMVLGILRGDT